MPDNAGSNPALNRVFHYKAKLAAGTEPTKSWVPFMVDCAQASSSSFQKLAMLFFVLLFSSLVDAMPQRGGGGGGGGGNGNGGVAQGGGSSLIRFGCSQIVIDRIDP